MEREHTMVNKSWKDKISNSAQLGGIELSTLDNEHGHGCRIAWVNTGSGLRFKLVLDRGMDIAEAFFNQHSLTWISHLGVTAPNPTTTCGINWLNSFGGGLLTTSGLTHIGPPEQDEDGERGLHDRIDNIPANLIAIQQPDLRAEYPEMSITAKVLQSRSVIGPHLELKRTISAKLGQSVFKIRDEVTNLGNMTAPHMLLYHFNFGWPLVDEGTDIIWKGKWQSRGGEQNDFIFNENNYPNLKKCQAPIKEHLGSGESVGFVELEADDMGMCECGLNNKNLGLKVFLRFSQKQLPYLTNWQHFGKNEYVTGVEPGTHPPIGRKAASENGTLIYIQPNETKFYEIEIEASKN